MRFFHISGIIAALVAAMPSLADNSFGWQGTNFYLNGEVFQIRGGQMDPQRVPWQLWDDRLAKAKAMGLNTIFSYIYWDQIEPRQGTWVTDENNNISAWVTKADAIGLKVVLRPGPYICGEHEWGGFPWWLSTIDGMEVRANNGPFLSATKDYLNFLGNWLSPYFASKGGPILMAQVENEYGFYGSDHSYTQALANLLSAAFPTVTLYTNDGSGQGPLGAGAIPGILAETDGGIDGFTGRNQWIDPSSAGPYLDGEYYITWLDKWSPTVAHRQDSGNAASIASIQSDLKTVITGGNSFSIYMFHGGTNFGYQSGASYDAAYGPVTTSYDYGAPLDESGRTTDLYYAIRETIQSLISETLPDVPTYPAPSTFGPVTLTPYLSLFDRLPSPVNQVTTTDMESLGQASGFILFRHTITGNPSGAVKLGDGPRDRAIIYVNNKRMGVIDATYVTPAVVNLSLKKGDVLDIFVENMGRANFGWQIADQRKGIIGDVYVGSTLIGDYSIYSLPCDYQWDAVDTPPPTTISSSNSPIFYHGLFDMESPGDTYLELPGWIKGVVYVNNFNIGRFWIIGPQQSLYIPGILLGPTNNLITVLNLEPTGTEGPIYGVSNRTWANNPDPDAP